MLFVLRPFLVLAPYLDSYLYGLSSAVIHGLSFNTLFSRYLLADKHFEGQQLMFQWDISVHLPVHLSSCGRLCWCAVNFTHQIDQSKAGDVGSVRAFIFFRQALFMH